MEEKHKVNNNKKKQTTKNKKHKRTRGTEAIVKG